MTQRKRLAILVGGGPAPGINGVISAATIEAVNNSIEVYGVPDGFKHLVKGNAAMLRRLSIDDVKNIHTRGGSVLVMPVSSSPHRRCSAMKLARSATRR